MPSITLPGSSRVVDSHFKCRRFAIELVMDWAFANSLSEKEKMRLWVETWKRVGPELERIKREELRALTDKKAYEQAKTLSRSVSADFWIEPERLGSLGLIEQQRLFGKARDAAL